MSGKAIEIAVLAAYVDAETERWREWFRTEGSAALDLSIGSGSERTIRALVKHVFAAELRYAQRLVGDPVSTYESLADRTVTELWAIHEAAAVIRDRFLREATPEDLERVVVSDTRKLGRVETRAQTVLVHTLIHSIRHWAQIAAVLRQHGHADLWEHDWLFSPAGA